MRDPLRYHFLELKIRELMGNADKELSKLTDDMELEIQPFDPEYEDRLRKWRAQSLENGGTYTEAEEVLEKMLIYYDLTARIFTRNVITQIVERHLMLGMLRLFNPVEILRMGDSTVEAIAAENKETRDKRKALKLQKTAIEEARSICASLAMRSDLRAYQDEPEDDTVTDDEDGVQRNASTRRTASSYSQNQVEQPSRRQEPRRPIREERPRSIVPDHTPTTPQNETHNSNNPYHQDSPREWDHPFYTTNGSSQPAPTRDVPPPPPRPQKVGIEEPERFYDTTLRAEMSNQGAGRSRESARQRLASAMRMGNS